MRGISKQQLGVSIAVAWIWMGNLGFAQQSSTETSGTQSAQGQSATTTDKKKPVSGTAQASGTNNQNKKNDGTDLDTVVVQDKAASSTETAAYQLSKVGGGTNLISGSELSKGTLGTVADVLNFQPGIYAKSVNGGEATRLSIRGSGIIRGGFLFGWGNILNLDGQRWYSTSGNPYEAIEPLAVDHVEVLRGANAFEYGPLSLGGSINYVSKTGYDASPFEARFEAGSFGYLHEQVSSGLVEGPADYYASVTRFDKDGYRDGTESHSTRVVTNFGYQITPDVSTRFFFRFAEQEQDDAGFLTWGQLKANPKQSQYKYTSDRVNPGTYITGNTTKVRLDPDSNLEIGFQYDNSPIDGILTPINGGANGPANTYFQFQGLSDSVRYTRNDLLFGRDSKTLISFINNTQLQASWTSIINATGQNAATRPSDQSDSTLLATNDFEAFEHFWINTGIAGIFQHRETSISESDVATSLVGQSISEDYWNFAPKLALRYEFTPTTQVYANVSRSIDTPSANSYIRTNGLYVPQSFLDLKSATATTVEVGTKGEEGVFSWNVSYYYSWINNELLTVQIAPGVSTSSNATPTLHQGIEVGFDTRLWEDVGSDLDPSKPQQQIVLRQAYTWNNFTYADDPAFGHNELAGVPVHLYQAELAYEHISGFYAGVNVEASLSKYAADFANTIWDPGYAIFGARIGYRQPEKGLEVFIEFRNLLNDKYAPVVSPVYNAHGIDSNVYAPGEGRSISGGIAYRF